MHGSASGCGFWLAGSRDGDDSFERRCGERMKLLSEGEREREREMYIFKFETETLKWNLLSQLKFRHGWLGEKSIIMLKLEW